METKIDIIQEDIVVTEEVDKRNDNVINVRSRIKTWIIDVTGIGMSIIIVLIVWTLILLIVLIIINHNYSNALQIAMNDLKTMYSKIN